MSQDLSNHAGTVVRLHDDGRVPADNPFVDAPAEGRREPPRMVVYRGDAFPAWNGSLLIGAMALTHLNRLVVEDGAVVLEERLARGVLGRIRSIAVDEAGFVYLGSDAGQLWRLRPE